MAKRILAIDDNVEFLCTLQDILEAEGYEVKTLSDSTQTENYIDEYKPDLMIIDIFMPERTGFNLVEDFRAKKVYDNIPKIFLTCLDDDVERMTARACGIVQYVTKPFEPEELIDRIKDCLKA